MKKKIFLNILFVFLTVLIITVAALSATAVGGILKTSYGEKNYGAESLNDPIASGIDKDITINPWELYDKAVPTVGEVLESNPQYLIPTVYAYDGKTSNYEGEASELTLELMEYNKGLSILIKFCDRLFSYTAPPVDDPFAEEESLYRFITEKVKFAYSTFFINDYEYTDKNGDVYILNAAVTWNYVCYFRIIPAESAPLSINTANYISRYVPDWLYEIADVAFFESQVGNYTGKIPDIVIPESPVIDFCEALSPLLLDFQDPNYSVSVSDDAYTILEGLHRALDRFYYYTATYEDQLLIICPPTDPTQLSENLILFYDPTLGKITGFSLTMYN